MKFRVRYAPLESVVQRGEVLTFEEECDLLEVWGAEARQCHKRQALRARYVETDDGLILEVIREPEDSPWMPP
jgi:hypothetical protein